VIKNEIERRVTAERLEVFRRSRERNAAEPSSDMREVELAALDSVIDELDADVREYDARRAAARLGERRKVVYVAGPITKGPLLDHVRAAFEAGSALIDAGFSVVLPHALCLFELAHPKDYATMMAVARPLVDGADALLRIPGESSGADREVEWAMLSGVPVFHTVDAVIAWPWARAGEGAQAPPKAGL
jgi:hypothetical protein